MGVCLVESYRFDASAPGSFHHNGRMFARVSAFVIWSLVAATAVFWALRFFVQAPQAPAYAVAVAKTAALHGDLTRLFGAPPIVAAPVEEVRETSSRFRLVGVMAPRSSLPEGTGAYGVALIAVDGKPAKAYVVGARLEPDMVLQSVGLRTASIASPKGAGRVMLELPALPTPATGMLPALGGTGGVPPTMAPPMVQQSMAPPPVTSGPLPANAPAPVPTMGVSMPPPAFMAPSPEQPRPQ